MPQGQRAAGMSREQGSAIRRWAAWPTLLRTAARHLNRRACWPFRMHPTPAGIPGCRWPPLAAAVRPQQEAARHTCTRGKVNVREYMYEVLEQDSSGTGVQSGTGRRTHSLVRHRSADRHSLSRLMFQVTQNKHRSPRPALHAACCAAPSCCFVLSTHIKGSGAFIESQNLLALFSFHQTFLGRSSTQGPDQVVTMVLHKAHQSQFFNPTSHPTVVSERAGRLTLACCRSGLPRHQAARCCQRACPCCLAWQAWH